MSGEIILERAPVDWERHRGDKRPKILPPPGEVWRNPGTGRKVGHRYYTRVTTYADAITEAYNLTAWKLRRLALGLGQRSDYVRLAAAYTDEDRDRDNLDELVGKALEAAGPNKADLGTALHSLTERLDYGEDLGTPPDEVLPDLAAYTALTEGTIRHVYRETRVVCDELECAGTPDTIAYVLAEPCPAGCGPDVLHIGDTKTGSIRYPGKMSTQLSIYSRSSRYDPATGERIPLEVCRSWGFIVHLPVETGEAALFWLDLEHGWRGAELCGPVREWHRAKADDILRPFASVQPVKVVDGEVTRIEPRLASVNINAPAPLADVTELLAASLAAAMNTTPEQAEALVETAIDLGGTDDAPDDAGPDRGVDADLAAARGEPEPFTSLDGCDVRVVGRDDAGTPLHWCADHDSAWPHEPPLITREEFEADLEASRRSGLPIAPGPDTCAHSGSRFIPPGGGLVCRDCGELVHPPSKRCETTDLLIEQCACKVHRPDLADVTDEGVEPDAGPTEINVEDLDWSTHEVPGGVVEIAFVDDPEQLASGPDSDAEDECDLLADEILGCITRRDLELLSSQRWQQWDQPHRDLAVERHDQLERDEAAARPQAAAEAAILSAATLTELAAVMAEIGDAAWMTNDLLTLADAQWRQLKRDAGHASVNA